MDKDLKDQYLEHLESMKETNISLREMFKNFIETSKDTVKSVRETVSPLSNVTAANPAGNVSQTQGLSELVAKVNPMGNAQNATRAQYRAPWRQNVEDIEDILREGFPSLLKGLKEFGKPKPVTLDRKSKDFSILDELLKVALGLVALFVGLTQDTSFAGALKILGKKLLLSPLKLAATIGKGFLNLISGIAKFLPESIGKYLDDVVKGIGSFIDSPIKATRIFLKKIGFGADLAKWAARVFGGAAGIALRAIPVIGSLIDFGFAYVRFKKGDIIGGLIDTVAGLVGLLSLTGVGAPIAEGISFGLNVLNAILDLKYGGMEGRAKMQESINFGGFFKGLGIEAVKGLLITTPLGWAISLYRGIKVLANGGSIGDALYTMAESIPLFKPVADFFGLKPPEEKLLDDTNALESIGNGLMSIVDYLIIKPIKWIGKQLATAYNTTVDAISYVFLDMPGQLYDYVKSGIDTIIDYIADGFVAAKSLIKEYTVGLPGKLKKLIVGASPGPLNDIVAAVGDSFNKAADNTKAYLKENVERKTFGSELGRIDKLIVGASTGPLNDIAAAVDDSFDKAANNTKAYLKENIEKKTFGSKLGRIGKFMLSPVNFLMDFVGNLIDKGVTKLVSMLRESPIPVILAKYSKSLQSKLDETDYEVYTIGERNNEFNEKLSEYFVNGKFLKQIKQGFANINLTRDIEVDNITLDIDVQGIISEIEETNRILTTRISTSLNNLDTNVTTIMNRPAAAGAPALIPGIPGENTTPGSPVDRSTNPN